MIRQVPRLLFADWVFWTAVAAWIFTILLSDLLGKYTKIRHSIRLAISTGVLALAGASAIVAFILRLSELYWPPIVAFFGVISVAIFSEVFQDRRRSNALPPNPVPPDDQSILHKAQELCRNLQLSQRFNPLFITWTTDVLSDEVNFESGFEKRNLLLPLSLKNKLSSDELRVLIACYLLRQKTELGKLAISLAKFFSPLIAYVIVFVYEIHVIVTIPYADLAWGIGYVVIASFALKLLFVDGKKQLLEIDLVTAQLVGKDSLLAVLKKIDDLKLHDMQRLSAKRDFRARLYSVFKPNLQERVDNLTKH